MEQLLTRIFSQLYVIRHLLNIVILHDIMIIPDPSISIHIVWPKTYFSVTRGGWHSNRTFSFRQLSHQINNPSLYGGLRLSEKLEVSWHSACNLLLSLTRGRGVFNTLLYPFAIALKKKKFDMLTLSTTGTYIRTS